MAKPISYCVLFTFMMIVAEGSLEIITRKKVIGGTKVLTTSPFMLKKALIPYVCLSNGCRPQDFKNLGLPSNTNPHGFCSELTGCGTCNTELGSCNYQVTDEYGNVIDDGDVAGDGDVADVGDVAGDGDVDNSVPLSWPIPIWMVVPSQMEVPVGDVAGDGDVDNSVPLYRPIPNRMPIPTSMLESVLIPPPEGSYWVCDKIVSMIYNCAKYGCGPTDGWGFCTYLDPSFNPNQE